MFRTPGALLPSHGLPPFGAMGDGLCGSSMFSTSESRWGVAGMATGKNKRTVLIKVITYIYIL